MTNTILHRAVAVSKPGEEVSQDAFCLRPLADDLGHCLAVSDGCSDSLWGGPWAKILVDGLSSPPIETIYLGKEGLASHVNDMVPILRGRHAPQTVTARERRIHAQEADYATLLVATILPESFPGAGAAVHAVTCGDSCLVVLSPSGLWSAHPVSKAAELNRPPQLVGSRLPRVGAEPTLQAVKWMSVHADTVILGLTDQLAKWFFLAAEAGVQRPFLGQLALALGRELPLQNVRLALPDTLPSWDREWSDDLTAVAICAGGGDPLPRLARLASL